MRRTNAFMPRASYSVPHSSEYPTEVFIQGLHQKQSFLQGNQWLRSPATIPLGAPWIHAVGSYFFDDLNPCETRCVRSTYFFNAGPVSSNLDCLKCLPDFFQERQISRRCKGAVLGTWGICSQNSFRFLEIRSSLYMRYFSVIFGNNETGFPKFKSKMGITAGVLNPGKLPCRYNLLKQASEAVEHTRAKNVGPGIPKDRNVDDCRPCARVWWLSQRVTIFYYTVG